MLNFGGVMLYYWFKVYVSAQVSNFCPKKNDAKSNMMRIFRRLNCGCRWVEGWRSFHPLPLNRPGGDAVITTAEDQSDVEHYSFSAANLPQKNAGNFGQFCVFFGGLQHVNIYNCLVVSNIFLIFIPNLRVSCSKLTSIFFHWVGSTTN